ncbi:Hypothetical predicted protein [Mytilus galloprovincialis]|uniref:Ig-like domain-containing protein n=1 Tax=Mytilus galloprovincialis TaxID=29158 RepID=A0A8B6C5I0_MYTGA|nr:Hypothetical predicted protein [Mytilus galloprovincialis]
MILPSLIMLMSSYGQIQTQFVTLSLLEKPVQFGQTLKLSCVAENKTIYDLNGVTWSRKSGDEKDVLVFDTLSKFESKYKEVHGEKELERVLKISKINASDVNANYSCEFGLHEAWLFLSLNEKDYVYHPKEDDIHVETAFNNKYSFINLNILIRKVYPVIRSCWFVLNTRNYSSDGPTKISNKGIFFELEFVEQIPLQGQGKEYIIKMICLIGNASYQIHKKHYIINSGENNEEGNNEFVDAGFIIGILTGIVTTVVMMIMYICGKNRCSKNAYGVITRKNEADGETESSYL